MKQGIFEILSGERIADGVIKMRLRGDTEAVTAPGQFVNIKIDGCYLRRPISVCDKEGDTLTLIYKIVGEGTKRLSGMKAGEKLDLLTGLGNGYNTEKSGDLPLLIGGGVGVPPLYWLCRALRAQGKRVRVLLGFGSVGDVFYEKEFQALGAEVTVLTADGTYGRKGFVTDAMNDQPYTYFYTCGPMPMFRAIHQAARTSGQLSFEERMGCGFGACMGCSCRTLTGSKRICKDGPVMEREEILWDAQV